MSDSSTKPSVLFVCVHNAGRSQMAAAFLTTISEGRIDVRSAGSQPADGVLVQIADQVLADLGMTARHSPGSTDANVPIALGIPAICIGVTNGDNVHREDEFINTPPIPTGFAHLITVILQSAEALA